MSGQREGENGHEKRLYLIFYSEKPWLILKDDFKSMCFMTPCTHHVWNMFVWSAVRTSTQVSISENWFMIGRMVSMELPERRSDLLPTRMMGILRQQKETFFYGTPKKKKSRCSHIKAEHKNILVSFLSTTVHQRNPFSPDLREKIYFNIKR